MKVKLTIYNGEKEYFSRAISTPCVIGRGKQSDVAILHPLISRQHCEIYDENGRVFVRDLGSLNGTFFGGARIGRGELLEFGSSFMIGKLSFKIDELDDATESAVVPDESAELRQAREELRRRGNEALDDFENIDSAELGLPPKRETPDESEELGLTPEVDEQESLPRYAAQTPEPEVESEQADTAVEDDDVVDDDLIDLEKFLKGEL